MKSKLETHLNRKSITITFENDNEIKTIVNALNDHFQRGFWPLPSAYDIQNLMTKLTSLTD